MSAEVSVQVRDARALRALAHPLRTRLLGLLRMEGPSTATRLGARLGESSGATSYHLRQLASYGFVEEIAGEGTGRERWWRAVHRMTSWQAEDFPDADDREVADELRLHQLDVHHRILSGWAAQRGGLAREWDDATGLNDYVLRLRPEQARALAAELTAVADRYFEGADAAVPAEGTELVSVLVDVLPLVEYPL